MNGWALIAIALGALVVMGGVSLWSAGRFLRRARGRPSHALPAAGDAPLDPLFGHDTVHAALIDTPLDALHHRLDSAGQARRSLDLMYYIWADDLAGRLVAQALLAAADRGVRVRILLDDLTVLGRDRAFKALDQHPRIEIRLFNPARNRDWGLLRGIELLFNLLPYNRRMHSKLWVADNRLAITGGRNLADEYFDLAPPDQVNFDDLDIVMAGPVVRQASNLFDQFWNAGVAVPLRRLLPGKTRRLRKLRQRLNRTLAQAAERAAPFSDGQGPARLAALARGLVPAPSLRLLADPPDKATRPRQIRLRRARRLSAQAWLPETLLPLLERAQHSVTLMTPYFIPGKQGLSLINAARDRGTQMTLITNALAVTDSVFVSSAYRSYRAPLLSMGVSLHEIAPPAASPRQLTGRRMTHTKAALIDGTTGFVGSFNFDLRSVFLNTEIGVVFTEAPLIDRLRSVITQAKSPAQSYHLTLTNGHFCWQRGDDTPPSRTEPQTTLMQRMGARIMGAVPIHRFL